MINLEEKNKIEEEIKEDSKLVKAIKEIIPYILIFVVVLFVKNFIIAPVQVKGESMESTLLDGDIMILNRVQYKRYGAERFDIVVISSHGTKIIKRVIGLPGDIVEIKDNVLYINEEVYEESYLDEGTFTEDLIVAVPEDSYFVLGDNREKSLDSRNDRVGFVNEDDIEGITNLTIFPFGRIGNKN